MIPMETLKKSNNQRLLTKSFFFWAIFCIFSLLSSLTFYPSPLSVIFSSSLLILQSLVHLVNGLITKIPMTLVSIDTPVPFWLSSTIIYQYHDKIHFDMSSSQPNDNFCQQPTLIETNTPTTNTYENIKNKMFS